MAVSTRVGHALRTEGGGEGEAVDDRGAHAHLVAFHAVETFAGAAEAAEDVAAADDDAHLHAHFADFANLVGIFVETLGVDAVTLGTHELSPLSLRRMRLNFISENE